MCIVIWSVHGVNILIESLMRRFSESRNHHSVIEFSAVLTKDSFDHIVQAFELVLDYWYFPDKFITTPADCVPDDMNRLYITGRVVFFMRLLSDTSRGMFCSYYNAYEKGDAIFFRGFTLCYCIRRSRGHG